MIFVGGKAIKSIAVGAVQIQEVSRGDVVVWRSFHEPEPHNFSTPGESTITPPKWATKVQYVLIGAGGGGCGGDGSVQRTGDGGGAGKVRTGFHQLKNWNTIKFTVGAGGRGGTGSPRGGSPGGASLLILPGASRLDNKTIFAPGGASVEGYTGALGGARQAISVDGFDLPRGSNAPPNTAGATPGDGGGGGTGGIFGSYREGQPGADGRVWLRFLRS
ncbi:glycine-rich domain-containing protein [Corynebacterium ulcerans]|uniref:glycine-rich domain-containing protein n=1 Tax=Corynebacterium ulcerans TaxID=65058 RepID=UPI0002141B72|nr:hypothetical protein [Corynebacterium ulcerans]AEG84374.1 hypothetical protein CULC22_01664 [Corynebacterium ulcerans BR-AD22]